MIANRAAKIIGAVEEIADGGSSESTIKGNVGKVGAPERLMIFPLPRWRNSGASDF